MFDFDKSYYFHDSISFNSKVNGPTVECCRNHGNMSDAMSKKSIPKYRQYENVVCTVERVFKNSSFNLIITVRFFEI